MEEGGRGLLEGSISKIAWEECGILAEIQPRNLQNYKHLSINN